jgi:hypothetical protein
MTAEGAWSSCPLTCESSAGGEEDPKFSARKSTKSCFSFNFDKIPRSFKFDSFKRSFSCFTVMDSSLTFLLGSAFITGEEDHRHDDIGATRRPRTYLLVGWNANVLVEDWPTNREISTTVANRLGVVHLGRSMTLVILSTAVLWPVECEC